MTLPSFATIDDLAARIPAGIAGGDDARAQAALDDVSSLIRAHAGKTWVTEDAIDADVPDIVTTVCLRAAQRAFTNPSGVTSESAGPFSTSYANSSSDVYLTAQEKTLVRQAAGKSSVSVIQTTRGDLETGGIGDSIGDALLALDPWGQL